MAICIEPTTPFNMAPAPQDQILHKSWSGGQGVAVLYLFAPSALMDQVRRSHLYQFSGETAVYVQQAISDLLNQGAHPNFNVPNNHLLCNALTPSQVGVPLPMRALSSHWMFVLLLDNVPPRTIGGVSGASNRLIYIGYCSEEPVNTMGLRATPNPHCHLYVTHRTQFSMNSDITPYGSRNHLRPVVNADVLHGQFYAQLSGDTNAFFLHPRDLLMSGASSGENQYLSSANLHVPSFPHAQQIASDLRSPTVHMNSILNALQYTVQNQASIQYMQPSIDRMMSPIYDLNVTTATFTESLGMDVPTHILGIDSSKPVSIAELIQLYPNISILPYKAPTSIIGTPIDPNNANAVTIVSTYLSDTIPSMMTQCGIGAIIFRYSSVKLNHESILLDNEPEVRVEYIDPFVPEPDQATQSRWDMFYKLLRREIFPRVMNMVGDFQVTVNSSAQSANYVQVQLMGRGQYCNPDEFFITHNPVGGLSTPLMGSSLEMTHNYDELHKLVMTVVPESPFNMSM